MTEESQAVEAVTVSGEEGLAEVSGQQGDGGESEATEEVFEVDVTESDEEAPSEESTQDSEEGGDDDEEATDGEEDAQKKGPVKLTAQERIQQEIERRKELENKVADLESKFQQQAEDRPFVDVDIPKLEAHIASLRDAADDLRLEGNIFEATRKEREAMNLVEAYEENETRKKEWVKAREAEEGQQQSAKDFQQKMADMAEFYRTENNIPADVWNAAGSWLASEFERDPVLQREFQERAQHSVMGAIRWAHSHVDKNMGVKSQEAKDKKVAGKAALVGGKGGAGKTASFSSYQQLLNLGSKAVVAFKTQNPDAYQKLFERHMHR